MIRWISLSLLILLIALTGCTGSNSEMVGKASGTNNSEYNLLNSDIEITVEDLGTLEKDLLDKIQQAYPDFYYTSRVRRYKTAQNFNILNVPLDEGDLENGLVNDKYTFYKVSWENSEPTVVKVVYDEVTHRKGEKIGSAL
jgi:hypothetical protein